MEGWLQQDTQPSITQIYGRLAIKVLRNKQKSLLLSATASPQNNLIVKIYGRLALK